MTEDLRRVKNTRTTRIIKAAQASMKGLNYVFAHETAFRQELWLAAFSVATCVILYEDMVSLLAVISSWLLVLIVEVINTAIETIVDRVSLETHPLSGAAKDLGSLAVLLTLINAFGWWGYALFH